jgi:TfoX/Sxy family transcriptional regulator of competence genes
MSGYEEKKMFGGIGFLLDGHVACGVFKDEIIVRVGRESFEACLKFSHCRIFDFTGRLMKGWVVVSQEGLASDQDLLEWVRKGVEFSLSLPPK